MARAVVAVRRCRWQFASHATTGVRTGGLVMAIRMGELLVRRGVLTQAQLDDIVAMQQVRHRPLGVLAEEMFGVSALDVEQAWAEQYAMLCPPVDLLTFERQPHAARAVTRVQAWQFKVLPVRYEGGELVMATTIQHLPRAMRFALRVLELPCSFVLAQPRALGQALMEQYPMLGMSAEMVEHAGPAGLRPRDPMAAPTPMNLAS
jgi:type IV pilus assembly protein PilB